MKKSITLLNNDVKVIEKVHHWLNSTFEIITSLSNHFLNFSHDLIEKVNPHIPILDASSQTSYPYHLQERLNDQYFELIITSANSEDVKGDLVSFLLKPLTERRLKKAKKKAFLKLEKKICHQSLSKRNKEIEKKQITKMIPFPLLKGKSIKLEFENIIWDYNSGLFKEFVKGIYRYKIV